MNILKSSVRHAISILTTACFFSTALNAEPLHLEWLDKSISPAQNFYQFANGTWQKKNPIPGDYARWGTFQILQEKNLTIIRDLLENTEKNTQTKPGSIEQKVGDFYFSGMNEVEINKQRYKPLQSEFDKINQVKNLSDLQQAITHLQMIGASAVFLFGQMQDFKQSNQVIGVASQDGLSLPDRDYYLKKNIKFEKIRQAYLQHVSHVFQLLGDSAEQSVAEAKTVMRIETALAKASLSQVALRDPHAVYHPMTIAQLEKVTPNINWSHYFSDIQHPEIASINLAIPSFFKSLNMLLKTEPLDDWKTYLRWHLIAAYSTFLSQDFIEEDFRFAAILSGFKTLPPRWKRVVSAENGALGFAIGKLYVDKTLPPSAKQKAQAILTTIQEALRQDLKTLPWMTNKTRQAALKKLDSMEERIGYPDVWRDYSKLSIDCGPYVLNVMRSQKFLVQRELNKIGKPVDKNEWNMTPQTVNAYYDPSLNQLNIPAGILQPPFFDEHAPAAVNYGGIGVVMGHEMTHGFDDQGAQFDSQGNLNNWWTEKDLKRFKAATNCIAEQFSKYVVIDDVHLQGKLVMGEAVADLGGVMLAYRAFHQSDLYKQAQTIDGLTPDQQFFLSYAHVWAMNVNPEEARNLAEVDPHPPGLYRVNGTLGNLTEFQRAYGIADGSFMVNKNRCVIW